MSNENRLTEAASEKRKRGRPPIDISKTISLDGTRRTLVNAQYMFEAISIIKESASEITDHEMLWFSDDATQTANGKHGILEQIGRIALQDKYTNEQCIFFANCSIQALKAGYTSREIEKAIRAVRMAIRRCEAHPDFEWLRATAAQAVHEFKQMGGMDD